MKKNYDIIKTELRNYFTKLNFPRIIKKQKKDAQKFIIEELSTVDKFCVSKRKHKLLGIFPITCYNIENNNDDYKYVIVAHYDTHPLRGKTFISNLFGKTYVKNSDFIINRSMFVISIILIFFISLLFFTCLMPFINYILDKIGFINNTEQLKNKSINMSIFIATIISLYYTLGVPFPKKPYIHDDNNSGVIGLIYLAKLLYEKNCLEKVKFVFTDKEELYLLGAKAFIKDNINTLRNKKIINFDCIGRGNNLLVTSANESSLLNNVYNYLNNRNLKPVKFTKSNSDDQAFAKAGLSAIGISMVNIDSKGNKSLPWIHTSKDTLNCINIQNIINIIETIAEYIVNN